MAARTHFSVRTHNEPQNLVEFALDFFFQFAFFSKTYFQICHNIRNFVFILENNQPCYKLYHVLIDKYNLRATPFQKFVFTINQFPQLFENLEEEKST